MDKVRGFEVLFVIVAGLMGTACDHSPDQADETSKRSAIQVAGDTPDQATAQKVRVRNERRATIDSLKAQIAPLPDSPERRVCEQQLRAIFADHVADVEGILPVPPPGAPGVETRPPTRTSAQNEALAAKIAKYDMRNPADVAEWSRVKAQVLGQ